MLPGNGVLFAAKRKMLRVAHRGSAVFRCRSGDPIFTYRQLGGKGAFINRYVANHVLRVSPGNGVIGRIYVLPRKIGRGKFTFVHGTQYLSGNRFLITRCNPRYIARCSVGKGII